MIVSNEPGFYEDNTFGIRIEVIFFFLEVHRFMLNHIVCCSAVYTQYVTQIIQITHNIVVPALGFVSYALAHRVFTSFLQLVDYIN
jgi:hypothetical protein